MSLEGLPRASIPSRPIFERAGRSLVEAARQAGRHSATMALDTRGHVFDELDGVTQNMPLTARAPMRPRRSRGRVSDRPLEDEEIVPVQVEVVRIGSRLLHEAEI